MHWLTFRKRHMVQLEFAILCNDGFGMERFHNERSVITILRLLEVIFDPWPYALAAPAQSAALGKATILVRP
jgi:hypothetical protein